MKWIEDRNVVNLERPNHIALAVALKNGNYQKTSSQTEILGEITKGKKTSQQRMRIGSIRIGGFNRISLITFLLQGIL